MRALAIIVLLAAAPSLAGDRPERVALEPSAPASAPAFTPADHPVLTTVIVSSAVVSAAVLIGLLLVLPSGNRQALQFPGCPTCRSSDAL